MILERLPHQYSGIGMTCHTSFMLGKRSLTRLTVMSQRNSLLLTAHAVSERLFGLLLNAFVLLEARSERVLKLPLHFLPTLRNSSSRPLSRSLKIARKLYSQNGKTLKRSLFSRMDPKFNLSALIESQMAAVVTTATSMCLMKRLTSRMS